MPITSVDMVDLFMSAKKDLEKNKSELNRVDKQDSDHGDNMVDNFEIITKAMKEKKGASPSVKLNHAAKTLNKKTKEISGQMLVKGLRRAAKRLKGKKSLTKEDAVLLTYLLIGVVTEISKKDKSAIKKFFDWLFGRKDRELDSDDVENLLNAGLALIEAKQSGKITLESLIDKIVAASDMGTSSSHRAISSKIVSSSFMKQIQ
jgi:hypothetical protein